PPIDALAGFPDLFLDRCEHVLVPGRDLDELAVPDAPHGEWEAWMAGRDVHEGIVVLGPKGDLPEAHVPATAVLGDIGGAVDRRPPKAGQSVRRGPPFLF